MSRFRQFLYLDDKAISRLLVDSGMVSAAADGSITEEGLNTPALRFRRLWHEIEETPEEPVASELPTRDETWNGADDGQFCKFTGELKVPSVVLAASVAQDWQKLFQLGQESGFLPLGGDHDEQLSAIDSMNGVLKDSVPVTLTTASGLQLMLPLSRDMIRLRIDEISGSATVYGRVSEKIAKGSNKQIVQVPGMNQLSKLNRAQQRQANKQNKAKDQGPPDMFMKGPGLVLRVIAIDQ